MKTQYLVSVAFAIALVTQCNNAAATQEYLSVKEAVNKFNQIDWRIVANNKIVEAESSNWIKNDKKYGESIRNVIGKAIGDCVTDMEEFAGKKEDDVITFAGSTPSEYSYANWNAVVLWNYLHQIKCDIRKNNKRSTDEIFEDIREKIQVQYKSIVSDIQGIMDKAISDIKAYDKELDLYNNMKEYVEVADKTKEKRAKDIKNITPRMRIHANSADYPNEFAYTYIGVGAGAIHKNNSVSIAISAYNSIYYVNRYSFTWCEKMHDAQKIRIPCSVFSKGKPTNEDSSDEEYSNDVKTKILEELARIFEGFAPDVVTLEGKETIMVHSK